MLYRASLGGLKIKHNIEKIMKSFLTTAVFEGLPIQPELKNNCYSAGY